MRNIRNLFKLENEEEDYYKPVTVDCFRSNNYIEYDVNGIKMKWKWRKSYQLKNKIRQYLKCIKGDLKKSDIWEIQLTITINFMYSKINNIEFMIYDNVDEVIEKNLWITF